MYDLTPEDLDIQARAGSSSTTHPLRGRSRAQRRRTAHGAEPVSGPTPSPSASTPPTCPRNSAAADSPCSSRSSSRNRGDEPPMPSDGSSAPRRRGSPGGHRRTRSSATCARHQGEKEECYAITEDGAGSDVDAIVATARRQGDDYILDGVKWHVTSYNRPPTPSSRPS